MAKGSRGGKRAKRASNAKYNGFSITRPDGTTSHYMAQQATIRLLTEKFCRL